MKLLLPAILALAAPSAAAAQDGVYEGEYFVRIFEDGSARVGTSADPQLADWSIDCRVDAMTDERNCSFHGDIDGLFVSYGTHQQPKIVCAFGHDYPGRQAMIRIDQNPALTTDTMGCIEASSIMPQLTTGSIALVRSVRWPNDFPVDASVSLAGFVKTLEVITRIQNGEGAVSNEPVAASQVVSDYIAIAQYLQPICAGLIVGQDRPSDCSTWDKVIEQLNMLGWCWRRVGQSFREAEWHPCGKNSAHGAGN